MMMMSTFGFFNHQFLICFDVVNGNVLNIVVAIDDGADEKADGMIGMLCLVEILKSIRAFSKICKIKYAFLMRSMKEA
jgi:hypothetical protein